MLELPPIEDSPDDWTSVGLRSSKDGQIGQMGKCANFNFTLAEDTRVFPCSSLARGRESTDETFQGFGLARFSIEEVDSRVN